jgi:oligopeptide/dipeptide ABC transporter ATP-binding protein
MYLGKVVESGPVREIFHNPLHPYTRLLLESIPKVGKKAKTRLNAIKGTVPLPLNMPPRCGFASRCPEVMVGRCDAAIPELVAVAPDHRVRCYLHSDESVSVAEGEHEHER